MVSSLSDSSETVAVEGLLKQAFNHSSWKAEQADLSESKASFVYIVSSQIARASQKDPVSN